MSTITAFTEVGAASLHAQEPDYATYWARLSDARSVDQISSIPRPDADTRADRFTIDGLQRLRKYELTTDRTDALVAIQNLRRAVEIRPDDAWAHYAYGAALARGSDLRMRPYAQRTSYKPGIYSLAASHAPDELLRAIELDPNLDAAILELAYVALDLTDVKLMNRARALLASDRLADDARALFMHAQIENRLGNSTAALELTDAAVKRGFDRSVAAIERVSALASAKAGDRLVAAAYFDGIDQLTAAGAERYFSGVVQIAGKREIETWRNASLAQRRAWLVDFWRRKEAIHGAPKERQIAALYAKYAVAYRVRGMTVIGGRPEEPHNITLLGRIFPRVKVGGDLLHNAVEYMISSRSLDYSPSYTQQLAFAWDILQFRLGDGAESQVVGAVQVVPASVGALRDSAGNIDAVLAISLIDTIVDVSARESAKVQYPMPPGSDGRSLLLGVSVAAPPIPRALVRLSVENAAGNAGGVAKGMVELWRFDPDSLTMSDIVLSPPDAGNSFERGDFKVALAPGRIYTTAQQPTLYYEIYGAADGEKLQTSIEMIAVDGGKQALSLAFDEVAANKPIFGVQQSRTIGFSTLRAGLYRLRVTITDSHGRKQARERRVEIR
jgi:hypothetical protein